MKPIDLILTKKKHLARLSNKKGAVGEIATVDLMGNWIARPKGKQLKLLLEALKRSGINIKPSSFDAIANSTDVNFEDPDEIVKHLPGMVFIEIKTSAQARVKLNFNGFFFALTESEIHAAEQLGERHRVALFNSKTGELLLTSVAELIARAKSTTWQVSLQL